MDPLDALEFKRQVLAEPDQWRVDAKAYDPKVKIQNDIFPAPHEIYNCTTCRRALVLPSDSREEYNAKCKWDLKLHIGPRWNDIGCRFWDRKITKVDI